MATSPGPLGYRNAVVLWSAQTAYGTAVAPATNAGLARVRSTKRSSNARYWGPGSPDFQARKGGSTYTDWEVNFPAVLTAQKAFLQKVVRAASVMPIITLGFGYEDDTTPTSAKDADQIQDAKINTARFTLDAANGHGPLSMVLNGIGGLITDLTTLARNQPSTKPWMTYEGVFTRNAVGYELRSLEFNLNQNLSRDHVIPGAAPSSFKRGHKYLTEHAEDISGTLTRYTGPGVNVQADTLDEQAMVLALTSLDDSTALTFSFANTAFMEEEKDEDENGIFWRLPFTAQTLAIT